MKVTVIGAGIVGVSSAIHLLRLGAEVTLIDRQEPGGEEASSYGNACLLGRSSIVPVTTPGVLKKAPSMMLRRDGPLFIRWTYFPRLLPWLIPYLSNARLERVEHIAKHLAPLLATSVSDHRELADGSAAAQRIQTCDFMHLYENKEAFAKDATGWRLRREYGFEWETLDGDLIRERIPDLSPRYGHGVVLKDHGRILRAGDYVRELTEAFVAAGGTFLRAAAQGIERTGDVIVIRTTGQDVQAHKVVIACGARSRELAKMVDFDVPLESERGYHVELSGINVSLPMPVLDAKGKFIVNDLDGDLRLAGLVEFAGFEATPSSKPTTLLLKSAKQMFPNLTFEAHKTWLGRRPSTTDSLPVIGAAPSNPDVYFAFGHQHVGLASGPKTGKLIAQSIMRQTPNIDVSAYSPDRFS